jgi:uncharacterized membrane protein YeiH
VGGDCCPASARRIDHGVRRVGLSVFVVTGANKALGFGLSAAQPVILGTITGVGAERCATY